jgi:hypothetical protein
VIVFAEPLDLVEGIREAQHLVLEHCEGQNLDSVTQRNVVANQKMGGLKRGGPLLRMW